MPASDERPQSAVPTTTKARYCGVRAAADDVEHHDEDQRRRHRLGDRVDEEQERVGPVGLHLPAEPGRRPEAAPVVARALDRGVRGGSKPPHSGEARPRGRAPAPRRAGITAIGSTGGPRGGPSAPSRRASSGRPAGRPRHRDEDERLDLGRRRPERAGPSRRRPAGASRRARRPAGSWRSPARRGGPRRPTGKLRPDTK